VSEYTIEGDESMRWDVISDDNPEPRYVSVSTADCPECDNPEPHAPHMPEQAPQEPATTEPTVACDGCRGDGIYYGRGAVVNGKFEGFTGTCFRCQGKGVQTPADTARCRYYDNRIRRIQP
jgi:hypothetical protein